MLRIVTHGTRHSGVTDKQIHLLFLCQKSCSVVSIPRQPKVSVEVGGNSTLRTEGVGPDFI